MKNLSITFVALLLIITSCTKETTNTPNPGSRQYSNNSEYDEDDFMTESQYMYVGEKHNEYLLYMLTELDLTNQTLEGANSMYSLMNIHEDFSSYEFTSTSLDRDVESCKEILDSELTSIGGSYLTDALNEIDNFSDVTSFQDKMDYIISEARANCNPNDFKIIAVVCSIFKHSAQFWAPISEGGDGPGYASLETRHGSMRIAKPFNWKEAMVSDGVSGGVGCIGIAIGAAVLGPVGWGALAICAGEAAINSGISGWL